MNTHIQRILTALAAAVFLLPALPAVPAYAQEEICVAWVPMVGFQEYDAEGDPCGYSYEYLMTVSQFTEWHYTFVPMGLEEALTKLKTGEVNLLGGLSAREGNDVLLSDREEAIVSSRLLCRKEESAIVPGVYSTLDGRRIGILNTQAQQGEVERLCDAEEITLQPVLYDSRQGQIEGLLDGETDVIIAGPTADTEGFLTFDRLKAEEVYFGVSGTELKTELDEAMKQVQSVNPGYQQELYLDYLVEHDGTALKLTEEEKAYIRDNPVVTVAYDPCWEPMEYTGTDGSFQGAMAQVFNRITEQTGLSFNFVAGESFAQTKEQYAAQADVISALSVDYEQADALHYRLTRHLTDAYMAQVYVRDPNGVIALPRGYYITSLIENLYQGRKIVYFDNKRDCIDAVRDGLADTTFLYHYELSYFLDMPRYSGLKFELLQEKKVKVCFAVNRNASNLLYSILNKAIGSFTREELDVLFSQNMVKTFGGLEDLVYAYPMETLLLGTLAMILLLTAVFLIVFVYTMRKKNRQLEKSNLALRKADAARSDFFSHLSHDMRTPLNAVINLTELAQEETDWSALKEYLRQIGASSRYLLGLVNDVLDMSRIEKNELHIVPEPYPVAEFIRQLNALIRPLCVRKNLQLVTIWPEKPIASLMLDRMHFNQIIFNLLSNAVKFTPPGGTITLRSEIMERWERHARFRFTVTDTGCGMSKEFLSHLFEPFAREENGTGQEGTGLGLAISHELAEKMHGTLRAQSVQGAGSTFTLELEAEIVAAAAEGKAGETEEKLFEELQGRRVLLCEDHPLNARIAQKQLEKCGMEITRAEDGKRGAEIFSASAPGTFDAILMDVRMPVMTGTEATERIRAMERPDAATVPIIAMTANAFEEDKERVLQAGMNAHISKPVDRILLYRVLSECIRERT